MRFTRAFIPITSSIYTLFSSAGSALFGTHKILNYVYGDEEDISHEVLLVLSTIVIVANVLIITDTRVPTLCRKLIYDWLGDSDEDAQFPLTVVVDAPDVNIETSPCLNFTASFTFHFLKICGLSSTFFSSLVSYLGMVTFIEFIAGNPEHVIDKKTRIGLMILLHTNALIATLAKFQTNYLYVYPAIKSGANSFATWLKKDSYIARTTTRKDDFQHYVVTLGLCSLNIISSPFLAYYTTSQTLFKLPFIKNYREIIRLSAALSSTTSLTSIVLSTAPAVRSAFERWWYKKEEDSEKIQAVLSANLRAVKIWNYLIIFAGFIDSLVTGANNTTSIINTSNDLFNFKKYNPLLMSFALLCGISALIVNAAFSVRRGHRAFLKNELYHFLRARNIIPQPTQAMLTQTLADPILPPVPEDVLISASMPIVRSSATSPRYTGRLFSHSHPNPLSDPLIISTAEPRLSRSHA